MIQETQPGDSEDRQAAARLPALPRYYPPRGPACATTAGSV